jgi:ATP:ADP antiporter, AAA family
MTSRRYTLRLVADIRPGEVRVVALLALDIFLLLTAYYVLKTAREPLILVGGTFGLSGAELKTYASAGQAVLLLGVVPAYARLTSATNRMRMVNGTILVVVACLLAFTALGAFGAPIGLAYYLWLGVASLLGVAQFWSFASDLYSHDVGQRVFPAVAAGGTFGALAGARLAHWLVGQGSVTYLLATGATLLVFYLLVYNEIERCGRTGGDVARAAEPLPAAGAFKLTCRRPYLLLMGLMVSCATLVNAQGEYIMAQSVTSHADRLMAETHRGAEAPASSADDTRDARRRIVGRIYADYYSSVNVLAFLFQCLLVSRLLKRFGVTRALFVMPMLAVLAYGGVAVAPMFALVRVAKLTENSADYSLHNTIRQTLFLPTTREEKYKAKAAIDTFFCRAGDVVAAGVVLVGSHVLGLSIRSFALVNVGVCLIWLWLAEAVSVRHRRLAGAMVPPQLTEPTSPS